MFFKLKMTGTSEEFTSHALLSSIIFVEYKLYLEKKRPQAKDQKIILASENKISEVWAFYFLNLANLDERNIDQPKFTSDHWILFTNCHKDCPHRRHEIAAAIHCA